MRNKRHLLTGASYHVISRINRQEFILHSNEIKEMFVTVLKEAKKKYRFEIWNFVVMSNHIHMMIKPSNNENLSRIMQWILSVFAIRFNKKMGYKGHVWYDRFKSYVIYTYSRFLATFDYIANNPVKAGLVKRPGDFAYSGITFLRNGMFDVIRPPDSRSFYRDMAI